MNIGFEHSSKKQKEYKMGFAKHQLEEEQELNSLALSIALKAGAIKECEFHPGTYLLDSEDIGAACSLANSMVTSGKIKVKNRSQLTDAIKHVIGNDASDECYCCAKWDKE